MDLDRMLHKCRRDQWSPEAIDFSKPPRPMTRDEEMAVVQYFTDMAGIERLAGALFAEQKKRAKDPRLVEIFESFVKDEVRHSRVASMLARHYDVHRYQRYEMNPSLVKFAPAFVDAIRHLTPEVANVYITTGEIILDVALLRSIDDYVSDPVSAEAMTLINRDESRHIAVDFHMVEYYTSDEYLEDQRRRPKKSLRQHAVAWTALAKMMYHAYPFFSAVFFGPMNLTDPSGKRLREAFKRIQLIATKPRVAKRPFVRFMLTMQDLFRNPVIGALFGRLLVRIIAVDPAVLEKLYTDDEADVAHAMSFDDLAAETLALKYT